MSSPSARRKILIVEDEPAIRNVLYVLLASLGFEGDVADTGQQALAMVSREAFDAVLLDLRCPDPSAEQMVSKIWEIRPNLVGRVLVVTGEVGDEQTMKLIERYCLPQISRERIMEDAGVRLRALLEITSSPKSAL